MDYSKFISKQTIEKVNVIINKYFEAGSKAYEYYLGHVEAVTEKAFKIALEKHHTITNFETLYKMAMLHDIGICKTNAPDIGCSGLLPYLSHANEGRKILENEGFTDISSICENHVGVGISKDEIIEKQLPLEIKDMFPQSLEEKIVCLADKFFSKSKGKLKEEKAFENVRMKMLKLGEDKLKRFDQLYSELCLEYKPKSA